MKPSAEAIRVIDAASTEMGKARAILQCAIAAFHEGDDSIDQGFLFMAVDEYMRKGKEIYENGLRELGGVP